MNYWPPSPAPRARLFVADPSGFASGTLNGAPVVDAAGNPLGHVKRLLIDRKTRQLRFIDVGITAIPWQHLYFDSGLSRLVFYTHNNPNG